VTTPEITDVKAALTTGLTELRSALEKTLVEIFSPEYKDLLL
jgi:hypothetical protein